MCICEYFGKQISSSYAYAHFCQFPLVGSIKEIFKLLNNLHFLGGKHLSFIHNSAKFVMQFIPYCVQPSGCSPFIIFSQHEIIMVSPILSCFLKGGLTLLHECKDLVRINLFNQCASTCRHHHQLQSQLLRYKMWIEVVCP